MNKILKFNEFICEGKIKEYSIDILKSKLKSFLIDNKIEIDFEKLFKAMEGIANENKISLSEFRDILLSQLDQELTSKFFKKLKPIKENKSIELEITGISRLMLAANKHKKLDLNIAQILNKINKQKNSNDTIDGDKLIKIVLELTTPEQARKLLQYLNMA